jgi:DNA-binding HxlR family transcriptional regulator
MRTARIPDPRVCSIDEAMRVLGEKWAMVAMRELTFGHHRFDEIVFNTGAPRDILAARLRTLEEAGLVVKRTYSERPVRYEYLLSASGENLFGVLHMIRDWGDRNVRDDPENITRFIHNGDHEFHPEMTCATCGEIVERDSVTSERDLHRSQIV